MKINREQTVVVGKIKEAQQVKQVQKDKPLEAKKIDWVNEILDD